MDSEKLSELKTICLKADKLTNNIWHLKEVVNAIFGVQVKLKSKDNTVKFIPAPLELENKLVTLLKEYYSNELEKLEEEYKNL